MLLIIFNRKKYTERKKYKEIERTCSKIESTFDYLMNKIFSFKVVGIILFKKNILRCKVFFSSFYMEKITLFIYNTLMVSIYLSYYNFTENLKFNEKKKIESNSIN